MTNFPGATRLAETTDIAIDRFERYVIAQLLSPHRVLSTSYVNGGQQDGVRFIVNHQSCEAAGHLERYDRIHGMGQAAYHESVCQELELSAAESAVLGTAANMQYTAVATEVFEEFQVLAAATAGVGGNAGRAGDPARWVERDGKCEMLPQVGTINVLLFFSHTLSPAALTRAVATMTEGKAAVLQELAIRSRISSGLATGTGTDQYALATPLAKSELHWAGKHCKLGEMTGLATMASIREALRWQNGLEQSRTRSIGVALERFGLSEEELRKRLAEELTEEELPLFTRNFDAIVHDPQVAGCGFAIATVADRLNYGTLPESAARDLILNQCALLASGLAAKPEAYPSLRDQLLQTDADLPAQVVQALILGMREKWC